MTRALTGAVNFIATGDSIEPANPETLSHRCKDLRQRARKNLDYGAIGSNYVGDVSKTIEILNRYWPPNWSACAVHHAFHRRLRISSERSRKSSPSMPRKNMDTPIEVAERNQQLGGSQLNPEGLLSRSASNMSKAKTWWNHDPGKSGG